MSDVRSQISDALPECIDQSVAIPPAPKGLSGERVWYPLRVVLGIRSNGDPLVRSVSDWNNQCMRASNRNRPQPITEAALKEGFATFTVTKGNGSSVVVPHCWCFHFAMHVDGTPWLGELLVPDMVIARAQDIIRTV